MFRPSPRSPPGVRSPVSSPGMKSGSVSPVKPFPGNPPANPGPSPHIPSPRLGSGTSPHALIMSPRPSASGSFRASPATTLTPRDSDAGAIRQSELELLRAFEPWRFSPFQPPLANGAAEADSSAEAAEVTAQRAAQKIWQQRALRAAEQCEDTLSMSRVDYATGLNDSHEDAWRRSTFVPPAAAADPPTTKSRGLRAVVATGVSSFRSLLSRGNEKTAGAGAAAKNKEEEVQQRVVTPVAEAATATNSANTKWQDRRFRASEEGRDTPFDLAHSPPSRQEVITIERSPTPSATSTIMKELSPKPSTTPPGHQESAQQAYASIVAKAGPAVTPFGLFGVGNDRIMQRAISPVTPRGVQQGIYSARASSVDSHLGELTPDQTSERSSLCQVSPPRLMTFPLQAAAQPAAHSLPEIEAGESSRRNGQDDHDAFVFPRLRLWDGCGPLLPDGWIVCACEIPVKSEWNTCPRCGVEIVSVKSTPRTPQTPRTPRVMQAVQSGLHSPSPRKTESPRPSKTQFI